jgi:Glycosyl hydrolase family 26
MRRISLLLTSLVCAALAVTSLSQPTAQATPSGMEFGAAPAPRSGETQQAAVLRFENSSGRHLDTVREFLNWDSPFPASFDTWLRDTDHTLILSVKSHRNNGTTVKWADIAAAQPGSTMYTQIQGWATKIKAYGVPIYFAFNHEPEASASSTMGTTADFIAAWRKIHDVFAAESVTNAKFIWIMTDYAFLVGPSARNYGPKWYPGDAYVDAMGIDAYNWYTCRTGIDNPWKSLEQIIKPFRDFGALHPDKELWLTEWASTEDTANPGRKAQFYADAQALFKRSDYSQFQGISYFDVRGQGACTWYTDSSASSQAAFTAMATDPFYNGGITPPPPPPPGDLTYVASAGTNTNTVNHNVQIPSTVQPGDTLLLFFTANQNPATTTPPAGWTQIAAVDPSGLRGRVWLRTATAGDARSTVTVTNAVINKADLSVVAYRGTGASPVDVQAVSVQTTTTTNHPAPSVTPTQAGDWVLVYWADKSFGNTGDSIPASLTLRRTMAGSSGGHITATLADTGLGVPAAPTGTFTGVGTAGGSPAVAYTIAFTPAS